MKYTSVITALAGVEDNPLIGVPQMLYQRNATIL